MGVDRGLRAFAPDVALALVIAGSLVISALFGPGRLAPPAALDYVIMVVGALALVAWRRAPVAVLLVTTVCMLVYSVRAHPGPSAAFPVMVVVYSAVRSGHRLLGAAAGAVFLVVSLMGDLPSAGGRTSQDLVERTILLLGWFLAAGAAGVVSRHRRAYLEQVEQRATEAERTREEIALRRAGEERLRIARELHDSLTHSISIIKVQAGVAVHLARKRGEEVSGALLAIEEASGEAMRELRATLEVLRRVDEGPGIGLDRIPDLVKRSRSAGLATTMTVSGSRREVPDDVDRAAYRIVQEALTNAARHAGPASASVHIGYLAEGLVVQVDDDGKAVPGTAPVPGHGLTGMRERVAGLGGRLRAEPAPEGGFTVRAELPLEER